MDFISSTDTKSSANDVKDGPSIESKMTLRVLVEKLDLGIYLKEKDYEERKKRVLHENADDSEYEYKKRRISKKNSHDSVHKVNKPYKREKSIKRKISRKNSDDSVHEREILSENSDYKREISSEDSDYKVSKPYERKKKIKRNISSERENSDDSKYKRGISTQDPHHKVSKPYKRKKRTAGVSAYEKLVEQKKLESMAFLQTLKMDEIKASLSEAVNSIRKKTRRPIEKKKTKPLPPRKSTRLRNLPIQDIKYTERSMYRKAISEAEKNIEVKKKKEVVYKKPIPVKMSFEHALKSGKKYVDFCNNIRIQAVEPEEKPVLYDDSVLQKLPLKRSNAAKITPEAITSLAWYPSADQMIIAAGSVLGNIGIWNVDSDAKPYLFNVHNERTTHVKFNPFNPVELFSSSYEGTVRRGDMIQNMFTKMFTTSSSCLYFDFLTSTTFLVGLSNGKVALVDKKAGEESVINHFCLKEPVSVVNIHPVNKNVFVTAGKKGSVCIWDLRKLQERKPLTHITYHNKIMTSAFFSPVTGNFLLTKSRDGKVCNIDVTNLTQPRRIVTRTNRSLCSIIAEWLPNSDDTFIFTNVRRPNRKLQLYNKRTHLHYLLMHENSIRSYNTFHPFVPSIAGLTTSYRVSVFT